MLRICAIDPAGQLSNPETEALRQTPAGTEHRRSAYSKHGRHGRNQSKAGYCSKVKASIGLSQRLAAWKAVLWAAALPDTALTTEHYSANII